MRVAVCDDEKILVSRLTEMLEKYRGIESVTGYTDPDVLLSNIEDGDVYDIVFMDICFEGYPQNGTYYAEKINRILSGTQIIFVTGNNEYSQDILQREINICGYLLKQVETQKLDYLLKRAKKAIDEFKKNSILVVNKEASHIISLKDLLYIESQGHRVIFRTKSADVTTYGKMDDYLKQLSANFLQCHKSYVVNMDEVSKLEGYSFVVSNGITIPISRSKYKETCKNFFAYMKSTM